METMEASARNLRVVVDQCWESVVNPGSYFMCFHDA